MPKPAFFANLYEKTTVSGLEDMAISFHASLQSNAAKHIITEQEQYLKAHGIDFSSDENSDIILKERDNGISLCHAGQTIQFFDKPVKVGQIIDSLLRVKKTLRNEAEKSKILYLQNIAFNPFEMSLRTASETDIRLTEKERDFLLALYEAEDKTLSRSRLLQKVWEYADGVETHTLETHVYRLRQKLENAGFKKEPLVTTENGYRLITDI